MTPVARCPETPKCAAANPAGASWWQSLRPVRRVAGSLVMKIYVFALLTLVLLGVVGCSTTVSRINQGDCQIVTGQKYVLQRQAILLAKRGMIDSIENPDRVIESYKPYQDYNPYDTGPIGVLSVGTLIEVKELRLFRDGEFHVLGEIVSGPYVRQVSNAYGELKRMTVGGRPQTGEVSMNQLCGGRVFVPKEFTRNLAQAGE
jgi:hypothetical protein